VHLPAQSETLDQVRIPTQRNRLYHLIHYELLQLQSFLPLPLAFHFLFVRLAWLTLSHIGHPRFAPRYVFFPAHLLFRHLTIEETFDLEIFVPPFNFLLEILSACLFVPL
jgi:hypothetical protein